MESFTLGLKERFSTLALVASIVATGICGGVVLGGASEAYRYGIIDIAVCFMICLKDFLTGHCVAPRLAPLVANKPILSVGDLFGLWYGRTGKLIAGLTGTCLCLGFISSQIFVIGKAFSYFLGLALGYGVVVLYTAYGGIRAVVATDVLQFFILVIVLPLIAQGALQHLGGIASVWASLPHFSKTLIQPSTVTWRYLDMGIAYLIPFLGPVVMQRLLMAKHLGQMQSAFSWAALWGCFIYPVVGLVGLLALVSHNGIEPANAFFHAVDTLMPLGFKGLALIGLLAACMSTADSYLNAASITLVRDCIQPFYKEPLPDATQLRLARGLTLVLGGLGFFQALRASNVIDLALASFDSWGSTVLIPLYAALWGFRASVRTFLCAAIAGQLMCWTWPLLFGKYIAMSGFLPSMLVNGTVFVLLGHLEGWSRPKPPAASSSIPYPVNVTNYTA
jgi:SSS family solute:Na+ symporter